MLIAGSCSWSAETRESARQVFAEKAKKLLLDDKVVAVLGCYLGEPPVGRCRCSKRTTACCCLSDALRSAGMQQELLLYRRGSEPAARRPGSLDVDAGAWKDHLLGASIRPSTRRPAARSRRCCRNHAGGRPSPKSIRRWARPILDPTSTRSRRAAPISCFPVWSAIRSSPSTSSSGSSGSPPKTSRSCTPIHHRAQEIAAMGAENARSATTTSFNYFQSVDTPPEQVVRQTATRQNTARNAVTNAGDGSRVLPDLLPRPGDREEQVDRRRRADQPRGLAGGRSSQRRAAGQGQDRREEPSPLALGAHRQGEQKAAWQFDVVWKSESWIRPQPWSTLSLSRPATSPAKRVWSEAKPLG